MENLSELLTFADQLVSAKAQKKSLEDSLTQTNALILSIEEKMVAMMDSGELQNFQMSGHTFYRYVESYPSVNKEVEEKFYDFLREQNEDGILKLSIHPQTLRAWWKQNRDRFEETVTGEGYLIIPEKIRIGVRRG